MVYIYITNLKNLVYFQSAWYTIFLFSIYEKFGVFLSEDLVEILNQFQVCTFHDGCKQGIDQQIFNTKSISHKIMHPQSCKFQAKLTGEKLKG